MSSHDLKIGITRYNNPKTPVNQRVCTRCESNEIDDEIHLFLYCNAFFYIHRYITINTLSFKVHGPASASETVAWPNIRHTNILRWFLRLPTITVAMQT